MTPPDQWAHLAGCVFTVLAVAAGILAYTSIRADGDPYDNDGMWWKDDQ